MPPWCNRDESSVRSPFVPFWVAESYRSVSMPANARGRLSSCTLARFEFCKNDKLSSAVCFNQRVPCGRAVHSLAFQILKSAPQKRVKPAVRL